MVRVIPMFRPSCVLVPHAVASMVSYFSRAWVETAHVATTIAATIAARSCLMVIFNSSSNWTSESGVKILPTMAIGSEKKRRHVRSEAQLSVMPVFSQHF